MIGLYSNYIYEETPRSYSSQCTLNSEKNVQFGEVVLIIALKKTKKYTIFEGEHVEFRIFFKNIDFSIWGKQCKKSYNFRA